MLTYIYTQVFLHYSEITHTHHNDSYTRTIFITQVIMKTCLVKPYPAPKLVEMDPIAAYARTVLHYLTAFHWKHQYLPLALNLSIRTHGLSSNMTLGCRQIWPNRLPRHNSESRSWWLEVKVLHRKVNNTFVWPLIHDSIMVHVWPWDNSDIWA